MTLSALFGYKRVMSPWTRTLLVEALDAGKAVEFLFFWGHTPKQPGKIDSSCLSQWFPRAFSAGGVTYSSAEHFMMAEKARLFGDEVALARVLAAPSAAEAKAIGREVRCYDDSRWASARFSAVTRGSIAKFSEDDDLRSFLLGTGDAVLVEASPRDQVWGIGLGAANANALDPRKWRGENLLGFALMEARGQLRDHAPSR